MVGRTGFSLDECHPVATPWAKWVEHMSSSIHEKLVRLRQRRAPPPRISYSWDFFDRSGTYYPSEYAPPFVVGVLGDFAGNSAESLPSIADRKFRQIDRDNFEEMFASMRPSLALRLPGGPSERYPIGDDGGVTVRLRFQS